MISHDSTPDLVIYNGAIHTPHSALACKHGRIVAIEEDHAVRALAAKRTAPRPKTVGRLPAPYGPDRGRDK